MRSIVALMIKLDRLVTAHWWWWLRLFLAERRLAKVLAEHDELSMLARRETVRYRRARFAFIYGRPVDPEVQVVIERARVESKVPLAALWALVINRDIRRTACGVRVRRAWWARPLMYAVRTVFVLNVSYIMAFALFVPGDLWGKLLATGLVVIMYAPAQYVWGIYTVRPLKFIHLYGECIDLIAMQMDEENHVMDIRHIP